MKQFFLSQLRLATSIGTGFFAVILCFVLMGIIAAGIGAASSEVAASTRDFVSGKASSKNTLLLIRVNGVIEAAAPDDAGLLSSQSTDATYGYQVKQELLEAIKEDSIKGVVVEIDSPGGTVNGSAAIADGISEYREKTKKPVYIHVASMAASGGYWAATAGNKILVDQGGSVGSIGVIMGPIKSYQNVVSEDSITAEKIESTYITAGQYKDTGNPYRPLSDAEKTHYQGVIDGEYGHFVKQVSSHRDIPEDVIKSDIKAFLYDADAAVSNKLADGIASREDTFAAIAKELNIGEDYKVEKEHSTASLLSSLVGAVSHQPAIKAQLSVCSDSPKILAFSGSANTYCK